MLGRAVKGRALIPTKAKPGRTAEHGCWHLIPNICILTALPREDHRRGMETDAGGSRSH